MKRKLTNDGDPDIVRADYQIVMFIIRSKDSVDKAIGGVIYLLSGIEGGSKNLCSKFCEGYGLVEEARRFFGKGFSGFELVRRVWCSLNGYRHDFAMIRE
jgi:hypothetical protein